MRVAAVLGGKYLIGELKRLNSGDCRALLNAVRPVRPCRSPIVRGAVLSTRGPRPNNEDSAAVAIRQVGGSLYGLLAVADGVGGKERGELASTAAICYVLYRFFSDYALDEIWLADLYDDVHDVVARAASGGATTLTLGLIDIKARAVLASNVGDSPLYLIDVDNRAVEDLTPDKDEHGRFITQALGDKTYEGPHILKRNLSTMHMVFLGVTDGVDDYVPRTAYLSALDAPSPLQYACALLRSAKQRTRDNATVAVLRI